MYVHGHGTQCSTRKMQAKSAKDVQRSNRAFLGKVFNDIIMMWKEEEVGLAHTHTPPPNGSIHREPVTTKGVCMYKWCWCTEYHWKTVHKKGGPLGQCLSPVPSLIALLRWSNLGTSPQWPTHHLLHSQRNRRGSMQSIHSPCLRLTSQARTLVSATRLSLAV